MGTKQLDCVHVSGGEGREEQNQASQKETAVACRVGVVGDVYTCTLREGAPTASLQEILALGRRILPWAGLLHTLQDI